jgi:hypothetical protein
MGIEASFFPATLRTLAEIHQRKIVVRLSQQKYFKKCKLYKEQTTFSLGRLVFD